MSDRGQAQAQAVGGVATEPAAADPIAIRPTVWPANRLTSVGIWLCLAGGAYAPIAAGRPPPVIAALAAIPAIFSALTVKFVFEALAASDQSSAYRHWRVAAPISVGVGLGVVILSGAVLGVALTAAGVLIGAACLVATLSAAVASRSLERRVGSTNRRIFFVGSSAQSEDLAREIGRRGDMRLVGVASPEVARQPESELLDKIVAKRTTTLVVSAEAIRNEHVVAIASRLNLRGMRVRALNNFYEEQFAKVPLSDLSPSWFLFDVAEIHRARFYGGAKRAIEATIAAGLLTLTAPIMPVVALAIRLSSPGPIFFRQIRVGKDGEHFTLTKFRTMTVASADMPAWATERENRVTGVGRLLRRTRLDELPQLSQVLLGRLSLVGPRPEQPAIVERLSRAMEFYSARHCVRPGLTGWAQVNYGYGGSDAGALEKLQYDFFYIRHQNLRLDIAIIAATIRTVIAGKGF